MMRRLLIAVLLLVIFLVAACARPVTTLQARPLNLTVLDKCANVAVKENAHCEAGKLLCNSGFKECGERCIPDGACCTDKDCGAEQQCEKNACVERPLCRYNEVWDAERKECSCADGTKFCKEQGKCVPVKSCCWHNDCAADERCALTAHAGTVCIAGETKKCKVVQENGTVQKFFFTQGSYDVRIQQVIEGGRFAVLVNNQSLPLVGVNETVQLGDAALFVESLNNFGGYCREDND